MIFYYIRHGDPIYAPDSLTELGHKQANALSKRLALYGLDEIYCSTSIRAQMTAQPTCDCLGKEKVLLDWTNENYAWEDFAVENEEGLKTWPFYIKGYKPHILVCLQSKVESLVQLISFLAKKKLQWQDLKITLLDILL